MKKKLILGWLILLVASCGNPNSTSSEPKPAIPPVETINKEISKEEYINKTLGGLLGQFAGFLSGYEFVKRGAEPYIGMPTEWFEFLNGPYAGNYTHYYPGAYAEGNNCYDRLKENPETHKNEVWSDDDYHIDIFNQTIIDEFGYSSYAIKEAWKKYIVSDWGGGADAMSLIRSKDLLAPFTGSIEAGNRYGWCTEAYIENETLGMNAPGMSNVTMNLVDKFASNVGYFDSVSWAKFYGVMYSLAYFETDIKVIMDKAKDALPERSYPRQMYEAAFQAYQNNPNDYKKAAKIIYEKRRNLYRIDNIQTDPNVNGAYAILSWLYGNNDYMDTCMYSSIMGFDGDCTAAICTGVMGIINGFKAENEEYQTLNDSIYYDGEGVYYNDTTSGYPPCIKGSDYFERIKIDEIVSLFQKNFEKILLDNGGQIKENSYIIPTQELSVSPSYLFENYDAEERNTSGFQSKNGTLTCELETENTNSHTGYAYFSFKNTKNGEVYHTFNNLIKGHTYRLVSYVKTNGQVSLFARDNQQQQSISFANVNSLIAKSFVFTATNQTMDVGFCFGDSESKESYLYFDDFMLEEIQRESLFTSEDTSLKLSSGRFIKTLTKPTNVNIGQEVILTIDYRLYNGGSTFAKVQRNGELFGSVLLSNTSKASTSGQAVVEIPYVFEKETDAFILDTEGIKGYFGNINIYTYNQYLYR